MKHERFLVAKGSLPGALGNSLGDAARQRADTGMAEEYFVANNGKFMAAQFFIGGQFEQSHTAILPVKTENGKAESNPFAV
jgi:hypothetical protein